MSSVSDGEVTWPAETTAGSVWADRVGERSFVGRNQRGVEIPIGQGPGQISPGELLKLALIGCAGLSADHVLTRRLGEDTPVRYWGHGLSDPDQNRFPRILEQLEFPTDQLSAQQVAAILAVQQRTVEKACTVERSLTAGVQVDHEGPSSLPHDPDAPPLDAPAPSIPLDPGRPRAADHPDTPTTPSPPEETR